MKVQDKKQIWRNPIYFLAFGFGLGLSPIMPGTIGSLGAIPLYLLMINLDISIYLFGCLILFSLGVAICNVTERDFGIKDNPSIVWDEIVGLLVALSMLSNSINWFIYTFIIFRVLDIFKPWPICYVEQNTSGGLAIMLDDLLAGIITLAIVWFTMLLV